MTSNTEFALMHLIEEDGGAVVQEILQVKLDVEVSYNLAMNKIMCN